MKLSGTMLDAYDHAKAHGGKLVRHAGGFWSDEGWRQGQTYFGTRTVRALVFRNAAHWSNYARSSAGEFPVQITINPLPETP